MLLVKTIKTKKFVTIRTESFEVTSSSSPCSSINSAPDSDFISFQLFESISSSDISSTELPDSKRVLSRSSSKELTPLTREPPQLIRADFAHILSIYRGHHAKKKPKRIWAHAVSFEGYGHFTDFSTYGKGVYAKIE